MNTAGTTAPTQAPLRRILLLTQYYPPETGAAPIRLRATVRELGRLGLEVRVLTGMPNYPTGCIYPGFEGRFRMHELIDGVPVTRVWLYPAAGRGAVRRLFNYLSFTVTATIALVFQPKTDLVFVEAQPLTLAIPALLLKVLRGTPYVYNTPDLQVEYADEDSWVGSRLIVAAARALEGVLMRQALTVSTVTRAFVEHFHREHAVPRERLTFLPNGADTELMRPLSYDHQLAAALGLTGRKVFTFAGTFARYQGLEVIVEAAALLRHRADVIFAMVGDGPERPRLQELVARHDLGNVVFHPIIPLESIPALMSVSWAAVVVLRKLRVATKMRLAKAVPPLACGVPVIFAGWGETAEFIARERVGIVVEPEDPVMLAVAIERLADDSETRQAMSHRARALAERDFTWQRIVAAWWEEVTTLAGGSGEVSARAARKLTP